jgi:hypothetical protein
MQFDSVKKTIELSVEKKKIRRDAVGDVPS